MREDARCFLGQGLLVDEFDGVDDEVVLDARSIGHRDRGAPRQLLDREEGSAALGSRIAVSDEGLRSIGNEVFGRGISRKLGGEGGLGLTIAAELATTMGGYLTITDDERTTFELLLLGPGTLS